MYTKQTNIIQNKQILYKTNKLSGVNVGLFFSIFVRSERSKEDCKTSLRFSYLHLVEDRRRSAMEQTYYDVFTLKLRC